MNKKSIALVAVVLLGLLTVIVLVRRDQDVRPALVKTSPGAASLPAVGPAVQVGQGDTAPPWANAAAPAPAAGAAVTALERQRALEKMQVDLASAARDVNHTDPKKVIALLTEMKKTYGSTVAGVNLDAMLNNVEKAQAMKIVAENIQLEAKKPGGPNRAALLAEMEQLKQLQAQMRTDISVPQTSHQP